MLERTMKLPMNCWLMLLLALALLAGCQSIAQPSYTVRSPDGTIALAFTPRPTPVYSVTIDGKPLIADSSLGWQVNTGRILGEQVYVTQAVPRSNDSTWENRFGKRQQVRDRYNELHLRLHDYGRMFELIFRVYDDGVAFRYVLPPGDVVIQKELTQFAFPTDAKCFAGSQLNGFIGPQEWEFWPTTLAALPKDRPTGLPLLVQTDNAWVAITESDLLDYAGMWLSSSPNVPASQPAAKHTAQTAAPEVVPLTGSPVTLHAQLAPRKDGEGAVKFHTPHALPWRVIMIGRQPGKLVESDIVSNLATPSKLTDTSWIKPGMMAWDHWWSGDVQMDTATIKQYIALASGMGWPYQLIDWQWYGPYNKPTSDITAINPAVDMDEVRRFAREKNVRLWLWLYFADVDRNDAYKKAFALYEQWGIAGIKIDFMDRDDQETVNWYEKIAKAAAEHHLLVDFHGAFKTSGFDRTYPNQVTREGILGNEYNRWSKRVTPTHKLTLPFTRFLAGPADFTPGGFLNRQPKDFVADKSRAQVQGTRAGELALFVAYDSCVCCVCDHPDHYRDAAGSDFLKIVPTVWDDTRVLDASVGEHLTIARRSGDDWFIAAMTNEQSRDVQIKLDFLGEGKWMAKIWKDAADSDVNAEHLEVEQRAVSVDEQLKVHLAPAGGCVIHFSR